MRITEIIWKEQFVDKIERKHHVTIGEVEEVLQSRPLIRKVSRGRVRDQHVYAAFRRTHAGRRLVVLFIDKKRGRALPISARDMDDAERRYYEKRR